MKTARLLFASLVCIATAACSDNMSPSDYRQVWRQAVTDYRAIQKDPSTVAASAEAGGSDDRQALSQAAHDISDQIRAIDKRLFDLKAPTQYQTLQEDTYLFYRGQADDYEGYANALSEGNEAKISSAADAINSYAGEQHQKIDGDLASLGRDGDLLKDAWAQIFTAPTAQPTQSAVATPPPPSAVKRPSKPKRRHKK